MLQMRKCWIPLQEVQLQENPRQELLIFLWMIFSEQVNRNGTSCPSQTQKKFQVGSDDWNDVTFTRQRIRWIADSQAGPCIEVSQQKAIDELEEIPVERNTKEDLQCTPTMHTRC